MTQVMCDADRTKNIIKDIFYLKKYYGFVCYHGYISNTKKWNVKYIIKPYKYIDFYIFLYKTKKNNVIKKYFAYKYSIK